MIQRVNGSTSFAGQCGQPGLKQLLQGNIQSRHTVSRKSFVIADNQNPDCVFFTSGSAAIKVGSIHNGAVSEFIDLSRALPGRCLRHIAQDAKGDFHIITSDSVIYTSVYAGWSVTRLTLPAEFRVWHPNYLQTIGDWGLLLADRNTDIMRLLNDTDRTITRFRV